jgi:hypothetical protein
MNFWTFLITRQAVLNKTEDKDRANQLAMLSSFMPGTMGMMMGLVLANREQAPTHAHTADPAGTATARLPSRT